MVAPLPVKVATSIYYIFNNQKMWTNDSSRYINDQSKYINVNNTTVVPLQQEHGQSLIETKYKNERHLKGLILVGHIDLYCDACAECWQMEILSGIP